MAEKPFVAKFLLGVGVYYNPNPTGTVLSNIPGHSQYELIKLAWTKPIFPDDDEIKEIYQTIRASSNYPFQIIHINILKQSEENGPFLPTFFTYPPETEFQRKTREAREKGYIISADIAKEGSVDHAVISTIAEGKITKIEELSPYYKMPQSEMPTENIAYKGLLAKFIAWAHTNGDDDRRNELVDNINHSSMFNLLEKDMLTSIIKELNK